MARKKTYRLRDFINDIHLWLGLASGIILFVVCLSGTVLTFEHEIKAATSEEMAVVPGERKLLLEDLMTRVVTQEAGTVTSLTIPAEPTEPYRFSVKQDPKARRGTTVLADPYTGEVRGEAKSSADAFLFTMFRLHRWLLLDTAIGRPIVGVATIIFLILALSGLVLWFPRKLRWKYIRQGFKLKTSAGWKRINHDLHNTLGFYACGFILVMGLTGLCWSFEGYREGLGTVIGAKVFDRSGPEVAVGDAPIAIGEVPGFSMEDAVERAEATLPGPGRLSVTLPGSRANYYGFRKYYSDAWVPSAYDQLMLDRSGRQLALLRFGDKSVGERIAALIKPLHTGEVFGMPSKILYFLACLIATSLPVTGTLIWWNKLRKRRG